MRWASMVAVAVGFGCGGQPAATTVTNAHADVPVGATPRPAMLLAAPRPDVAISALVPDPTEEARWPLTMAAHPILEPHFDIAGALAEPGVSWLDLCGRGIQSRHLPGSPDLGDYLRAWCAVARHDTKDALYRLSQLHVSSVPGLAVAVKHDCANILADHGPADDLQSILSSTQLHDVELLDLTAASYFEVDRNADAFEVNKIVIDVDRTPSQEVMCRRLVRGIIVGDEYQRGTLHDKLKNMVVQKDPNLKTAVDPTCVAFEHEIGCWLDPRTGCADYLRDQHRSRHELAVFEAFASWPVRGGDAATWRAVAARAGDGAPEPDAYRLALPAIALAVRSSQCDPALFVQLEGIVTQLLGSRGHDHAFDAKLDALESVTMRMWGMPRTDCQRALATWTE